MLLKQCIQINTCTEITELQKNVKNLNYGIFSTEQYRLIYFYTYIVSDY